MKWFFSINLPCGNLRSHKLRLHGVVASSPEALLLMPITDDVAEPLASSGGAPDLAAAALSHSSICSLLVSSASATLYRPDPGRQQEQALPIVAKRVTFCVKWKIFAPF